MVKVQKLHQISANIKTYYINKTISEIVKNKPSYIVIEYVAILNIIKSSRLKNNI